ncbi:non-ribosomal peptide synthetase [Bradyrhizobium sp. 2S1]|uniref:non-ribosomal peptide synthetase n=1 Tax=Bradyrhizobium sp. 2S1 TaxID=1404429 RepID=UPI00140CD492|nr:non-ribosomal peptide synthetase [Bradyrhizobium sp. 2S1]MCK7673403.1 non-ribosomal peptide synthetase [Bradyrhizobium sp. 2S1]
MHGHADVLVETLSSLLDIPADRLDDESDLLCLGLDSVRTMRAASRLRRAGIAVTFSALIGKRTLADWRRELSDLPGRVVAPPPDARASAEPDSFDLATMQHAFWVGRGDAQQLGGVTAHFYAELDGDDLDPERMARAVDALVQHHPMLRMLVTPDGRQRVLAAPGLPVFRVHDLRGLDDGECARQLVEMRQRYSHQRLRVEQGEVIMIALSRRPDGRSRLHIDLDMMAGDAVSLRNILRELAFLYEQPDAVLPRLELTYEQYLQHARQQPDAELEKDRSWWQARLDDMAPPPALPLRSTQDTAVAPRVVRHHHWLDPLASSRLNQLCRQNGVTLTAAMTTLFAQTVGLWSGGDPFLLNLPVFSRQSDHPDIDGLVGDFSSSVLINACPDRRAFLEQVRAQQHTLHEAAAHAAYSGVEVLRDLTRRQQGQQVLAPVVFTSALSLGDLYEPAVREQFGEPAWSISQGPQVWLDAQVTEYSGGVLLNWDVRDDVFIEGVVAAMFDYYRAQLERLLEAPESWHLPLQAPPPVMPIEPQQVRQAPVPEPLFARVFARAAQSPDAVALLWSDDDAMSYGDLAERVLRVAAFLHAQDVRSGDSVAITMPKGWPQIVAALGVLAAGCTYVPCGIDLPQLRRDQIYQSAGVRLVLVGTGEHGSAVRPVHLFADAVQSAPLVQPVEVPAEQAMYVIFTSGSTGVPKGVEVSHRAVANTIDAVNRRFGINATDRTLTLSELDFDLSAYDIFAFLAYGGSVVVVDETQRRDAHAWLQLIRRRHVNVISCVPALLDMLLTANGSESLAELRLVMLGGDRILPELAQRWWRVTNDAPFVGLGGMTEAAIHSTCHQLGLDETGWSVVPYGHPLDNMSCRVVDRHGRDCPAGVAGELWVSGPGVAIGYRGDPERTADKFVAHGGRRWYRSGDHVRYRVDGVIEFLGRADNQVKIRGHRIELGEVEAVLSAHPSVEQVLVVVVAPVARQLCALAVLRDDTDVAELREWAAARLPKYAVPEHYQRVPQFPLTANGKIDRKILTRQAEQALRSEAQPRRAPAGEIEQRVAGFWQSLLSAPDVGRDDNFFVLGGDSLIATRLMAELRQAGLVGQLADLFAKPELAAFCATLQQRVDEPEAIIRAEPAQRFEPFALTDIQRAFWIGRSPQMPLGGVGSHFYVELDGPDLDVKRLESNWRTLVARHDMLRAVVTEQGQQRVLKTVPAYKIRRHQLSAEDAGTRLEKLRQSLSHTCYDVTRWPLFDIQVAEYAAGGETRARVFVSLDSLMLDGRSIMVLFTEWDQLYSNGRTGLLASKLRFRDYVVQHQPDPQRVDRAQRYWQARIAELPDAPALPLQSAPETLRQPRFRRLSSTLDARRWRRFRERAQQHGITPSVALAAAYGEVLGYWSNQPAVAINLTLFDRPRCHDEIDRVVGDFASILLLGYQTGGGQGFVDAAQRLQRQEGEGLTHRDVSGVWVLRELARHKGEPMATMPVVFTSVLGLPKDASLDLSPAFPRQVYAITQTPQVWLDAKVSESRDGLVLEWDGVDELFAPGVLDDMFAAYVGLVERLVDENWVLPVRLAPPAVQQHIRQDINSTALGWSDSRPLYLRFFAQARRTPTAPALVCAADPTIDYQTLAGRALQVAGYLAAQGVRPGDRVAITHAKGPDQVIAVLGVLAAGGCYVPSGIDLPAARREIVYRSAGVRLVLTDDASHQRLDWPAETPVVPLSVALGGSALEEPVAQPPEAIKYIIFTSGSTGVPKGVEVSHAAVANTIDAVDRLFAIRPEDRTITLSALDFDLSAYDLFAFLSLGASVVVISETERRDAAAWVRLINRWKVTVISAVPALVEMITIAAEQVGLTPELRLVMVGGDRVTRALPEALWRCAPQARFAALGGMTEAAIHSTCHEVTRQDPQWACAPYGRPLANMRCRVVDGFGRDCPDWVKGELWVAGRGVAQGYRGDAARTHEKFVAWDDDRWYRTGDVARYHPSGILEFLGRADNQVKIRGHRIELAEVEGALVGHPQIEAAAAVLLKGAAAKLGAAVIAAEPLDLAGVRIALQATLPDYEVPEYLLQLERFPLTANGKIDRVAIAVQLAAVAAGGTGAERRRPTGAVERLVADLWSELLGHADVGADDNFFALGGDSLIATRLMTRLQGLGYRGALAALFTQPQLGDFAATLVADHQPTACIIVADEAARHAPFPLTDVQQAYWLGRRDDFELGGIGAQCYVEYDLQNLDVARLERAWSTLVARHDMLCCVIDDTGLQRVLPSAPGGRIHLHDLRAVADQPAALASLRDQLSRQTRNAGTGGLVDVHVIHHGEAQSRLAVLFDNLVVDGLSMLTLLTELFQLYHRPDQVLAPIGIRFRDYVCARVQTGVSERALDYWRERLAGLPPAPALPTRVEPSTLSRPRFARVEARLAPEPWSRLTAKARGAGITPSVLLLTCFSEILSRWSGQSELVVNLTLFDRPELHPDINRVVGDFTSLILAAYRAGTGESWLTRAERLQAQIWQDLDHQEVSAVRVLRELAGRNRAEVRPVPVVFTSMLGVADALAKETRWPDFTSSQTPQVWLDHQAIDLADGLLLSWDYVESLFPDGMIAAMFDSYLALLHQLIEADWRQPLHRALPEPQRAVRNRVNATTAPSPIEALHEAFFRQAGLAPRRRALWTQDSGEVSYGTLARQALSVAAYLQRRGVRPGDRVGISCRRGAGQVAAVLGVLAAGAAYVPINPAHPPRRQALMCAKADIRFVLADHAPVLPSPVRAGALSEALETAPLAQPCGQVTADALAYIIFTSGSTGEPKGVEIEHRSVVNTVDDICWRFAVDAHDVVLGVSALDFDLSVFDLFGSLGRGATLVLTSDDEQRDADRWLELMIAHGVTVWNSVPALLEMTLTMAAARKVAFPALRLALLSGDWVAPDIAARLALAAPRAQVIALGGATEASIWSNAWAVGTTPLDGWGSVPYGLPLRNQSFRVVDALGDDAPDWVPGELWIGGQGVARGYCGAPDLTGEQFGGTYPRRWYRTGDLGRYRPDGVLEFLGRRDGQIKLRGHRIELGEIEQVLQQHDAVRRAVAIVDGKGEAARLLAFVEPHATAPDLADLRGFLRDRLPAYAVPAELVPVSAWPLNANGKIDRRRLAELRLQPSEQPQQVDDPREREIAGFWHELLDARPRSRTDSFFALGGNSLLGTRLVARLSQHYGITLSLREFFTDATLAGLSASVAGHLAAGARMEEGSL